MIVGGVAVLAVCWLALRHLPESYWWSAVVVYWVMIAGALALVAIIGPVLIN